MANQVGKKEYRSLKGDFFWSLKVYSRYVFFQPFLTDPLDSFGQNKEISDKKIFLRHKYPLRTH